MIGIIFNHDFGDDPYKQTSVEKGLKEIIAFGDKYNEKFYFSYGEKRHNFPSPDLTDEFILVYHSSDLTSQQKQELVSAIKLVCEVKRTVYKDEKPDGLVIFKKVNESEYYEF